MPYEQELAELAKSIDQIAAASIKLAHVAENLENDFRPSLQIIASLLASIDDVLRRMSGLPHEVDDRVM